MNGFDILFLILVGVGIVYAIYYIEVKL